MPLCQGRTFVQYTDTILCTVATTNNKFESRIIVTQVANIFVALIWPTVEEVAQ